MFAAGSGYLRWIVLEYDSMLKGQLDKQRLFVMSLCLMLGFASGFSITNRLSMFLVISSAIQTIMLVLLAILLSVISFFLIQKILMPWLTTCPTNITVVWVFLSLVWAGLILLAFPFPTRIPSTSRVLEIISQEGDDAEFRDSSIWLVEIEDHKGSALPFYLLEEHGDWIEKDGMLVSGGSSETSLKYAFNTRGGSGEQLRVLFLSHPGGGKVTMRLNDHQQEVDLYDKAITETQIFIPLRPHLLWAVLIYGIEILSLAFFSLTLALSYYMWSRHHRKRALQFLIIFEALFIALVVGLSQKISAGISNPTLQASFLQNIWLPILFSGLLGGVIIYKNRPRLSLVEAFLPFVFVLTVCYGVLADWNRFYVAPDSIGYVKQNYSIRPPVYPLFVTLVTAGSDFDHSTARFEDHEPVYDPDEPLMRVARAQKVFLFACSIVLAFSIVSALGVWMSPLVTILMLWLFVNRFFPLEMDYILVEALVQGELFLLLAAMFLFFKTRNGLFLSLGGVLVAVTYLTRSASAYTGIFLAAMFLWAFINDRRRHWKSLLVSTLLFAGFVMLPVLFGFFRTGKVVLSPQYASAKVLFAIQLAQPEDIAVMPDEQSREFLSLAIAGRDRQAERIRAEYADSHMLQYFNMMASNVWLVAYPIADELTSSMAEQEALINRVSTILISHHQQEYYALGFYALKMAEDKVSRLNLPGLSIGFWELFAIGLALCLVVRGWAGSLAAACLISHFSHMVIQCFYNVPDTRHIYASEFLVILAYFLLLFGMINLIVRKYFGEASKIALVVSSK